MIALGSCDLDITDSDCKAYQQRLETITRVPMAEIVNGADKLSFSPLTPKDNAPMTVRQTQEALRSVGFFPGGSADAICGYRTLSAIRLFQEYVRTVEKQPGNPDGLLGPGSQKHLWRWIDNGLHPVWTPTVEQWRNGTLPQSEYTQWLSLLNKVRQKYLTNPNPTLDLVNQFSQATDTKKVADWDFDPRLIHLIGIRRGEISGKFDDVMVLLVKGLVFKFQGSTEPGHSSNEKGTPFLVQGQHDYHFGWHRRQYLALRPQGKGVLVVRSKTDNRLDPEDLKNGLEPNGSINIHWGGKGGSRNIGKWSEGCQVINGTVYINHENEFVDCSGFVAINNGEVARNPAKSRGAYNVLLDLVTALSGDMDSSTVKYMLLTEDDLTLDPKLDQGLADARGAAAKRLG